MPYSKIVATLCMFTSASLFAQAPVQVSGESEEAGSGLSALIPNDLPQDVLRTGIKGSVRVRVQIDPIGRVDDCEIVESSGYEQLDDSACDTMLRYARYSLALNEEGEPIRGSDEMTIRFDLD
jgi:protein TonB